MSIWEFQQALSRRLLQWSVASAALGVVMVLGRSFWRGVGSQFIGWAAVDAAIAWFGLESAQKRMSAATANAPGTLAREARNLRALLLVNTALDALYIRGGLWLALRRKSGLFTRGMGIGILIQGAFLFAFDLVHATRIPSEANEPQPESRSEFRPEPRPESRPER